MIVVSPMEPEAELVAKARGIEMYSDSSEVLPTPGGDYQSTNFAYSPGNISKVDGSLKTDKGYSLCNNDNSSDSENSDSKLEVSIAVWIKIEVTLNHRYLLLL